MKKLPSCETKIDMETVSQLLEAFRQAETGDDRRSIADMIHTLLPSLPATEQAGVRALLKQFILSESKQAFSRIESALSDKVVA
jgi:hypothetical protein